MRRRLIIAVLLVSCFATTAKAMMPVFDYLNMAMTSLKATYATVTSSAMVTKTVQMLEQIATLYQTYENARDMYASIGRVGQAASKFESGLRNALDTWRQPVTWKNLGPTLDRWGIHAAQTGPLGEVNLQLGSYTNDLNRFVRDANAAPGRLNRDVFVRNVVRGVKNRADGELDQTSTESLWSSQASADRSSAELAKHLAVEADYRDNELKGLAQMEASGLGSETDQLVLQHQDAILRIRRNRVLIADQDQDAAVALAQANQRRAMAEMWDYQRQREQTEAALRAASGR